MEFNQETIQQRYETLPQELKEFLSSPEIGIQLVEIGSNHNIHYDKLGILSDEIIAVVLRLKERDSFVSNIESLLSIDRKTAQELTAEINDKILKPIQHLLFGDHENHENIKRDDILAEIENPTPHQTNKVYTQAPTTEKEQVIEQKAVNPANTKEISIKAESQKADPVQSIIEKKLSQTISTPSEHTVVEEKKVKIDPYRESIL